LSLRSGDNSRPRRAALAARPRRRGDRVRLADGRFWHETAVLCVPGECLFLGEKRSCSGHHCNDRVELIKEAIPALTRVAVLVNPASPALPIAVSAMQRTARALGMELVPLEVNSRDDIAAAIAGAAAQRLRALALIEEPLVVSNAREIADLGLQSRVPMIGFKPQAEAGALMEYGVDLADLYFRAASFVHKILKGTPPGELPIERAVKFGLIVNLKTAKTLGIELPTPLLIRANEVIE
jgi:putative tryptophan/tyrosine transport system substrate-binding protein